jgi:hypothetical protein
MSLLTTLMLIGYARVSTDEHLHHIDLGLPNLAHAQFVDRIWRKRSYRLG